MLANIQVHQNFKTRARRRHRLEHRSVVHDGREFGLRIFFLKREQTAKVGADGLEGEEHIGRAGLRAHFRFGDGGAFEAGDAEGHLALHEPSELVGFDVRAKSGRAADKLQHPGEVPLDRLQAQQKSG